VETPRSIQRLICVLGLAACATTIAALAAPSDEKSGERTELMLAANAGNHARVKTLLGAGGQPKARDRDGMTALMYACAWTTYDVFVGGKDEQHAAIIRDLVEAGAPLNDQDDEGRTALLFAVMGGHFNSAQALLKLGADVRKLDKRGRSALTYAAFRGRGDAHFVRPLLAAGAQPTLVDALLLEDLALARTLARTGKPRGIGPEGETPLMLTAEQGSLELVQLLLRAGAAVLDTDDRGYSVLLHALGGHPVRTQGGLTRWSGSPTEAKQLPVFEAILSRLSRSQLRSGEGAQALRWATELGFSRIVRRLLERGADPNALDKDGAPPLTSAVDRRDLPLVRLLLECGADPHQGADSYQVPLVNAVSDRKPDPRITRALLSKARINDRRHDHTLLMFAANEGTAETIRLLIQSGARVDLTSRDGTSALMVAARRNSAAVVKALLAAGADPRRKNRAGKTALDIAAGNDDPGVAALLKGASSQ